MDSGWQLSLRYGGAIAALATVMVCGHPLSSVAGGEGESVAVAQTGGPLRPREGPVWAPLSESNSGIKLRPESRRPRMTGRRLRLVVKDNSADAQPGTGFNVYLGLTQSAAPVKEDPHLVGRFWLYNEINAGSLKATPSVRTYDITPLVERLLATGALGDPVGVTIAPDETPPANANVTIGSIAIVTP